jgi:hypothetical protein
LDHKAVGMDLLCSFVQLPFEETLSVASQILTFEAWTMACQ